MDIGIGKFATKETKERRLLSQGEVRVQIKNNTNGKSKWKPKSSKFNATTGKVSKVERQESGKPFLGRREILVSLRELNRRQILWKKKSKKAQSLYIINHIRGFIMQFY